MRKAGIVMALVGFVALVISIISLIGEVSLDRYPPMFGNSWVVIMALFWFISGIALVVTFGKGE
uniref:Uncharacterized protein n=1 Tax=Roseihalotalea indica TaxID=2867963 RepID=A0AA49GJC4_9BACT|nr:hypothetical protein K4G66_25855 [Tunicatimonas sp. TK19036]